MGSMATTPTVAEMGRLSPVLLEEIDVAAPPSRLRPAIKRGFDASMALLMIVALLPALVLIAVAIKLDSRGPVFYRVRRVGYHGAPLMMLKFRKMAHDASGIPLTAKDDQRLTRIGKLLTRTRLDELPQLWDVLRGRMSLVGPRPEDQSFVSINPEAYERILTVRPGMTGLSQLAYAEEHEILDADDLLGDYVARILPQKITIDTLYARSYSFRVDCAVIVWTVVAMLLRRPLAVHRTTGRINVRRRPARPSPVRQAQPGWPSAATGQSQPIGSAVFAQAERRGPHAGHAAHGAERRGAHAVGPCSQMR